MTKPTKITPAIRRVPKPAIPESDRPNSLLYPHRPLLVNPELARLIKLPQAVFLQQLEFWLDRATHEQGGRKWVYNNIEEWQADFPFWDGRTIQRIVRNLVKQGLLDVVQFNKRRGDRTNWYAINYEEVERLRSRQENQKKIIKSRKEIAAQRRGFWQYP